VLVLSRKEGEQILIGDNVTITVLKTTGTHVKLGINAPKETRVARSELLSRGAAEGPPTGQQPTSTVNQPT
jgi:carbon storage regulator